MLRNKVDDPEFTKMVDDIKEGNASLRDVVSSPVFTRALDPLAQQAAEKYESMTEEEREELARTGEAQFEEMRQHDAAEATSQQRDASQDDENDDLSDRSWLE